MLLELTGTATLEDGLAAGFLADMDALAAPACSATVAVT